jgi:hypothetical protein
MGSLRVHNIDFTNHYCYLILFLFTFRCGLPSTALHALYNEASTNHQDTTFIFLTGDYVHSGIWLYSVTENGRHILNVTKSLKEAFPDTEIFPLVGNHEPDVVNMYPPESKSRLHAWSNSFNFRNNYLKVR